jgi:carboxyl-terminal processing protease
MNLSASVRVFALCTLLAAAPVHAAPEAAKGEKMGEVASTVARMLESAHYSRQRLNDEVEPGITQARKALDRYLELLDYNRLFFTQKDIDEFSKRYGDTLQNDIMLSDLSAAYAIYDRFLERVSTRVDQVKTLLEKDFTFDSDRTVEINRDKSPWPADEAEADRIWEARVEAERRAK